MDFHCLWHSTLHIPQGYEEWVFTSWHLTMSNELEEATAFRLRGSFYSPVDIVIDNLDGQTIDKCTGYIWIRDTICHGNHAPYYRSCQVRRPVNKVGIWISSRTTRILETLRKCKDLKAGDNWKTKRLHKFITDIIHERCYCPADSSPSMCASKRWYSTYSMARNQQGQTLVPKGTHFLYTLCTINWTHCSRLDLMMKDCFCLPLRHWWH